MSTLTERLQRIKTQFLEKAPPAAVAAIDRSNDDLRSSGMLGRIPKVGDVLAPFDLADTEGGRMRSSDLVGRGPLVVTFYRGGW